MGFSVYYSSTRAVSSQEAAVIRQAARASAGRTWLSCEPVDFLEEASDDSGRLVGASKPNFTPHPDDVASARSEGLPDGNTRDLLDVLCLLSRDHGIDWEIRHDHEPGPVGYIRQGVCDRGLVERAEAFAELAELIGGFEEDDLPDDDDGEDEGPTILRLWGGP